MSLALYPLYSRWRYKRHYLKFIRDTYKNRFGEKSDLEFTADTIEVKSKTGEVKINKSEISEINEIRDYYFIRAKSGETIIVSKTKSDNLQKIKDEINVMVATLGIKQNIELNWKWR